jgi:RND family efflux transporter MFP subunit
MFVVVVGATLGIAGAGRPQTKTEDPKPKGGNVLDFSGRIEASTAEIRPRVTGAISRFAVKEGAAVKAGELLVELDPRQYQAELELMKARLEVAVAGRSMAAAEVERMKKATEKGVVARADLDRAVAEQERAAAMVSVAKAELELAKLNLDRTKLTAPMDGRVVRFSQTIGSLVVADGPAILSIVATDPLVAAFDLDEKTFLKLRREGLAEPGKLTGEVGLADEEGFPHKLVVDFIYPEFNPTTGTLRVRGVLHNPKGLFLPGMFIRIRLSPAAR